MFSYIFTKKDVYKRQDFVVVGYYTGGRAFAQYMGNADSNTNVEQKTKSLEDSSLREIVCSDLL